MSKYWEEPQLHHLELKDPQRWEAFFENKDHRPGHVGFDDFYELKTRNPTLLVRQAQLEFRHLDADYALKRLQSLDATAPARGVSYLALAHLGRFSELPKERVPARGASALELEEAVYANYAVSIGLSEEGHYADAIVVLETAVAFAEALGLTRRLQLLRIELSRIRAEAGLEVNLQIVLREISNLEQQPAKRWGGQVGALLHFSVGDVEGAKALAETEGEGWLPEVLTLLADPAPRCSAADRAARTVALLSEGESLTGYSRRLSDPWRAYETLLEVDAALAAKMPHLAAQLLGATPPGRPDQAVWWALAGLEMLAGSNGTNRGLTPRFCLETLEQALARMVLTEAIMYVQVKRHPLRVLLAAFAPNAPTVLVKAALKVPLLLGDELLVGVKREPLNWGRQPPDYALGLFAEKYKLSDRVARLERREHFELRLNELGVRADEIVLLPQLYRAYSTYASLGDDTAWRSAADNLLELSPQLKEQVGHTRRRSDKVRLRS